eukprot:TRINITY_DN10321_c0_g1_i1.p1 TRINITY_DN10321_c0_g1~~TRINITY_DN10321_c0_g1_i1.p1  ORF type:complete len:358 (+),score=131.92 TRINITY_DN10321_c0_g1_i1:62-1135(+)
MADRRKARKRGGAPPEDEEAKLDKTKQAIAHWLRRNVPVKKTKFYSDAVEYFNSGKAIDMLMNDSPWSKSKAKPGSEVVLESRYQAIDIMHELLRCKMFHRAKKIPVAEKEKKKKKGGEESEKEKEKEEEKQDVKKRKGKKGEEEKVEREKKKRKIRLEMHQDQIFIDGNEAYVWIYDPKPWYYHIAGTAIVLGIIAVCLFPLWPIEMRQGVYYLSVAAAGFLVCFICLAIIKYIIFVILFICTRGKLKFWIFPNLTEDVGVIESFKPAYVYTYDGPPKKDKESDEEESESESEEEEEQDSKKGDDKAIDGDGEGSETGRDEKDELDADGDGSQAGDNGSDSAGSSKEFEIIDGQES